MKKILLSIILLMGLMTGFTQEGYKVSGKIEGFPDDVLFLMSEEKGKPDTLGSTRAVNGIFEFTGEVSGPMAAYITMANQKGAIPFILENANFIVKVTTAGAGIKGGIQQEIYKQFSAINIGVLRKQEQMQKEFRMAEQERDKAKMEALVNKFNIELVQVKLQEEALLKQYADSYVAAYVVASGMQQLELEALKARYALLGESAKATIPGISVAKLIAQQEKLNVGNVAPDFTVKTSDGGAIALKDVKGKVKLISFWASWSVPSRQENINLLKIYRKYNSDGLEIVSISLDDNKLKWVNAAGEDGIVWGSGSDLKGQDSEVARLYFVRDLPHSLLLDENNVIVAKNLRGDALRKKIVEMLKEE